MLSPLSPKMELMPPDLSVACHVLMEAAPPQTTDDEVEEMREYKEGGAKVKGKRVPVYVIMPLDNVMLENAVNRRKIMNAFVSAEKC
ncbi:hypothetical protein LOK49_LG09G02276 [Camellia lanceoleosa]|uniref:Uncharacterized protein n=1 Tax=Camellia lanceoleosa TaxID=1840588 RepID=A0ACC0GGG4_9ERIC|nr:hypothetical protein LOK49_LG09G02276 [Camellia lanceoleosa]